MPEPCLHCGVCCFSRSEAYVRVNGDDWGRLGEAAEQWAHFVGNRAYLRMHEGHCAALEIRTDADGASEYFCRIYEHRPEICRALERGSPQCEAERARKSPQRATAV